MWALAVVPFAVLAVATSSAFGAAEYLCAGEPILTSGNCLTLSINLTPITLEDMSLGAGVYCLSEKVTDEDEIISATVDLTPAEGIKFAEGGVEPNCKPLAKVLNLKEESVANACTLVEGVKALNLPWETKIEEEEAGPLWWILIVTPTAGYLTECESALGLVADECLATSEHTPLVLAENLPEEETIEEAKLLLLTIFFNAELLEPKEAGKCSLGGAESALVIGEVLFWAQIMELLAGGVENNLPASLEIS